MEQVIELKMRTFTQYIKQLSKPKMRKALQELDDDMLHGLMDVYIVNEHYELCGLIRDELNARVCAKAA